MKQPSNAESQTHDAQRRQQTVSVYPPGQAPEDPTEQLKYLLDLIGNDIGISPARWTRLVEEYVVRLQRERGEIVPNMVEARASVNKNFGSQKKMTWKNFFKGLFFIRAKRVLLTVEIEHVSGAWTKHGMWMDIDKTMQYQENLDYDPRIPTQVVVEPGRVDSVGFNPEDRRIIPPPDLSRFGNTYPSDGEAGDNS